MPVLVDVEPATRTLDAALVAAAITPRTRAIVPVHLYGQCADIDRCSSSREARPALVEDCAQAHGAECGPARGLDRRRGRVQLLSDEEPRRARRRRGRDTNDATSPRERGCCATTANASGSSTSCTAATPGSTRCRRRSCARSCRISTTGRQRRRAIAARYDEALDGTTGIAAPARGPGRRHVYHLYVVETGTATRFGTRSGRAGIETAVHYPRAIHQQPAYRKLGDGRDLARANGSPAKS